MLHRLLPVIVLVFCAASFALAQDDCTMLVSDALSAVSDRCTDLERNLACYANVFLDAAPHTGVENFTFEAPGIPSRWPRCSRSRSADASKSLANGVSRCSLCRPTCPTRCPART